MEIFMQGLNVAIYGLGLVFLTLLVLMVSIMVIGKALSVTTGKGLLPGSETASPPTLDRETAPTSTDEPRGVFPVDGISTFGMGVGGRQFKVEYRRESSGSSTVIVDGAAFQVRTDGGDPRKVVVNGRTHSVELQDVTATSATVVIDGMVHKIDFLREVGALAAAPPCTPAPATGPVSAPSRREAPVEGEKVTAPLPGKLLSVAVQPGDKVRKGDELCVIEAMKMANSIKAQRDGTVKNVLVSAGDSVKFDDPLMIMG